MHQRRTARSILRAQWFFDLDQALHEAERLLNLLEADNGFPAEAVQLRLRIRTVKSEIEQLNRVMPGEGRVIGTNWPQPAAIHAAET